MSLFSENVKKIRKSRNLSMTAFGKLFNPSASSGLVSNWENDYNFPNKERLERLAELGNMSMDELLGNENFIKQKQKDIEMWKRVLENHTNNLDSLQNLKDSNYHTDIMGLLTEIDNDLLKIIVKIDAGKLNLEGVKMELDTLQSGLDAVSFDTYDDMKALDANIASNKSTIDLANRKLKELGYNSASNNKTNAD